MSCKKKSFLKKFSFIILAIISLGFMPSCSSDDDLQIEESWYSFKLPNLSAEEKTYLESYCSVFDPNDNKERYYNVLLPLSYDESEKDYPVIYFLHGYDNNFTEWLSSGSIKEIVDYYISDGTLPECIIVMPDAGNSYYVDGYDKGNDYETFFINYFIPEIESKYRIISEQSQRFIVGNSMGGYGAAYYCFKYPDLFDYFYSMTGSMEGRDHVATPPVIDLIKDTDKKSLPDFTIETGTHDSFLGVNRRFHSQLEQLGIQHEFILRPGGHNWNFWKESIYLALERIGKRLKD